MPAITGMTLSQSTLTAHLGATAYIYSNILPAGATGQTVWTSSDTNIATVSGIGYNTTGCTITPVITGTCSITGVTEGTYSGICTLTVVRWVTGITLNASTATIQGEGNTYTLTETVLPTNATDRTVVWTTSDSTVATVTAGVVKAVEQGTTIITATANDGSGIHAHCTITVDGISTDSAYNLTNLNSYKYQGRGKK